MTRTSAIAALLASWLGACLLFAAVVAPAAFAVLPSRALAGALAGRVLPVIFIAGFLIGIATLWLDRSDAGRSPRVRRAALAVVVLACAVAQFVVAPRIERVRSSIPGPIEQLAVGDARRAEFGRLHAASVGWLGLAMVASATAFVLVSLTRRA